MELSLITKAQKEQKDILVRFYEKYNNVEMDFPDVSLTELFVKAAKVYPKKIAVLEEFSLSQAINLEGRTSGG